MKLDRLVLIWVCVLAATFAMFWVSTLIIAAFHVPFVWLALLPAALVGYIVYRVIAERIGNEEDDHYDGMKH